MDCYHTGYVGFLPKHWGALLHKKVVDNLAEKLLGFIT